MVVIKFHLVREGQLAVEINTRNSLRHAKDSILLVHKDSDDYLGPRSLYTLWRGS